MPRIPNRFGGGARTNEHGLQFEQGTNLNEALEDAGFTIRGHEVYFRGNFMGLSVNKAKFATVFLRSHNINDREINSKRWEPDEAFVNECNKTVYIIEKKFQEQAGSVDEKLATFPFKIKEYQRLLANTDYDLKYIYLLSSEWFNKPKYQDYYYYMDELNCPYYFDTLPLSAIGL